MDFTREFCNFQIQSCISIDSGRKIKAGSNIYPLSEKNEERGLIEERVTKQRVMEIVKKRREKEGKKKKKKRDNRGWGFF